MIQAYEGEIRVTGLDVRFKNQQSSMNITITADSDSVKIYIRFLGKQIRLRIENLVAEQLASYVRRMVYDARRANRITS